MAQNHLLLSARFSTNLINIREENFRHETRLESLKLFGSNDLVEFFLKDLTAGRQNLTFFLPTELNECRRP